MPLFTLSEAFRLLNGVFCVHKPKGISIDTLKNLLSKYLIKDLNSLDRPEVRYRKKPVFIEDQKSADLIEIGKVTAIDYSTHPLVLGPKYREMDLEFRPVHKMDFDSSGLCLMSVNDGCDWIEKIHKSRPIKAYRIECRLGRATLDYSDKGKIIEKTTFAHVTSEKIDRTAKRILGKYKNTLFEVCGAPLQSQLAYELASGGLMRPKEDSTAIIYNAKCVDFMAPAFTLEIHAINETDEYLKGFVNDLGLALRSTACYVNFLKIRHGLFNLDDHALLMKHWTLENILRNIQQCQRLLTPANLHLPSGILSVDKPSDAQKLALCLTETIPSDLDDDPDEWTIDQREAALLGDIPGGQELRNYCRNGPGLRPELRLPLMDRSEAD